MNARRATRAAEFDRDLERVSQLWRRLGHTPRSIDAYCVYLRQLLRQADYCNYRQLSAERVVQLSRIYARRRHIDAHRARWMWLSSFRALAWGLPQLGQPVGSIDLPAEAPREHDPVMLSYKDFAQQFGWAEHTLSLHLHHLVELRRFLRAHRAPWPVPRLGDIDRFLQAAAKRWARTTVGAAAGSCRTWLRFLFVTGRSARDLSASVALPPSITYPRPPRALPWGTVRQLHRGIDPRTPIGRRDDAQYLLFCAYGLSSAEVAHLKLEDIDWDRSILHIRRIKNGATVDLPLLPAVAHGIARYLRQGRPRTTCRRIFVRHTIPFGPINSSAIGQRVQCWARRAQVKAPFLGTHLFRHSFATRQLEQGIPLKVIGDILGHRSSQTTGIYVRSALSRLRRLALPVPT